MKKDDDPSNPFANLDALRNPKDYEEFAARASTPPKKRPAKREQLEPGFTLLGAAWSNALQGFDTTFAVARRLANLYRRHKGQPVVVGSKWFQAHGVGRKAKVRELRKLEATGLISIKRLPRCSLEVTFLVRPDR